MGAVGGEKDFCLSASGGEGNDVPDFGGDDVRGDEVELVESVGDAVGIDVALVGSVAVAASGGLDLNAEEGGILRKRILAELRSAGRVGAPVPT